MRVKPDISEKIKRYHSFLNLVNTDRPLVGFWIGSYFPVQRFRGAEKILDSGFLMPEKIKPEDFFEDYDRFFLLNYSSSSPHASQLKIFSNLSKLFMNQNKLFLRNNIP